MINKLLVIQTWGIGDLIMTIPILTEMRKKFPHLWITLVVGSKVAAEVIDGSNLSNEIRVIPTRHLNVLKKVWSFFLLNRKKFDAAVIATHINPKLALILYAIGIKKVAGDSKPPRPRGYTHWSPIDGKTHRVLSNQKIIQMLFPEVSIGPMYFHIAKDARMQADSIYTKLGFDGHEIIGIHPGGDAQYKIKRFPKEKYGRIIQKILLLYPGFKIVIFIGPDDKDLLPFFYKFFEKDKRLLIVQDLPIKVIASLISRCNIFLAGDSGLGHIASAMGVPVVTLAGPTQIDTTQPWGNNNIVIKTEIELPCIPCYGTNFFINCNHVTCMKSISELQVVENLLRFKRHKANPL